jgi:hypothetical protein
VTDPQPLSEEQIAEIAAALGISEAAARRLIGGALLAEETRDAEQIFTP